MFACPICCGFDWANDRRSRRCVGSGSAPEAFEPLARLGIEALADPASRAPLLVIAMLGPDEVTEKALRGQLPDLLARDAPDGVVGGDDAYALGEAVLGREPLEKVVGVAREANRERPDVPLLPDPVEDDHSADALSRHVAREQVDEFAAIAERACVEEVVAVEEVEGRVGHANIVPADRPYAELVRCRRAS
jgi:hypothetical protein